MQRSGTIDATKGALLPKIIIYAIPLMISTLIQSLFNAVDLVVLRYAADGVAVASVGATSTITALILNTFIGLSGGSKVLLARFIGAKDRIDTKKTVNTSILTALSLGVIAALIGVFFAKDFLNLTNCPEDCFSGAVIYLVIYFLASPAILVYNYGSGILQISGDTRRPLVYMVISGLTNILLNILLCLILPQKVVAVAVATLVSQLVGATLVLIRLTKIDGDCKIEITKMRFSGNIFVRMMKLGLPMGVNNALFPLANLQIQSAINSFGPNAITGSTAEVSVEGFISCVSSTFGTTALTFIGQNLGANDKKRVNRSFIQCLAISAGLSLILGITCYTFGRQIFSLYCDTEEAIDYAMVRAKYIIAPYIIATMNNIFSYTLQAFGYSLLTSLNSIFSVFIFRIFWMQIVYPKTPTYNCAMSCFFISWLIMFTVNIIMVSVVLIRYQKGKFKKAI